MMSFSAMLTFWLNTEGGSTGSYGWTACSTGLIIFSTSAAEIILFPLPQSDFNSVCMCIQPLFICQTRSCRAKLILLPSIERYIINSFEEALYTQWRAETGSTPCRQDMAGAGDIIPQNHSGRPPRK